MKKKRMSIRDWEVVENTISIANQEEEYNQRMLDNALQTMKAAEQEVVERIKWGSRRMELSIQGNLSINK